MRVYETHELRIVIAKALSDPALVPREARAALLTARTLDGTKAIFALKVGDMWDLTIHADHSFPDEIADSGLSLRGTWS